MSAFRKTRQSLALTMLTLLMACSEPAPEDASQPESAPAPESLGLGVDLDNMDRGTEPQEDFFQYMNGGWLAETEIPGDRSRWGSFDALNERAEEQVLSLVQDVANTPGHVPGSDEQKVADMYLSFMGEPIIDALGLDPLQDELAAIDGLQSHDELPVFWARQVMQRVTTPLTFGVNQDPGQSDRYVTVLNQSGLGLPDREYYLSDDDRFTTLRRQYREHITNMLSLADVEEPAEAAEAILGIETRLAESHWTRAENRDRNATYNLMTIEELGEDVPDFDWRRFLDEAGLDQAVEVVVRQPDYMETVATMISDIPMEQWRDYQRFHLLRRSAPYLPSDFADENFNFYGRTLQGQPEMRPRERRAANAVERALGFMVGQLYVDEHFRPEARERMTELVDNLLAAFETAIDDLDWMGEETRAEAQTKLANL
ncbi:MAG: M13 family peptidase, partial [Pseudomonadota bacterium]